MLRTIVIENPGHLFIKNSQLMIRQNGNEFRVGSLEDIGWLLLEHPQLTFTQAVLSHAAENNTVVIFCNERFYPSSVAVPLEGNTLQGERQRWQIDAPVPRKKGLWKQIVQQKIKNQAALLDLLGFDGTAVRYLVPKVKSGDTENVEAVAARRYWPLLFDDSFRRERIGLPPNNMLNYGYAILRSCAVRMLISTGLQPGIGIHHKNKYNAFALADDIMEPYRPWVDRIAWSLFMEEGVRGTNMTPETKRALLEVLQHDVLHNSEVRPLAVSMRHFAVDVGNVLGGKLERLRLAEIISLNIADNLLDGLELE
jgi:CRISP-associated protein Cas1